MKNRLSWPIFGGGGVKGMIIVRFNVLTRGNPPWANRGDGGGKYTAKRNFPSVWHIRSAWASPYSNAPVESRDRRQTIASVFFFFFVFAARNPRAATTFRAGLGLETAAELPVLTKTSILMGKGSSWAGFRWRWSKRHE